jgi:hypothetical protein
MIATFSGQDIVRALKALESGSHSTHPCGGFSADDICWFMRAPWHEGDAFNEALEEVFQDVEVVGYDGDEACYRIGGGM